MCDAAPESFARIILRRVAAKNPQLEAGMVSLAISINWSSLDNGPHNSGHRTRILKRLTMTKFAAKHDLEIVPACYPPYRSTLTPSSAIGSFLKTIGKEYLVYRGDHLAHI